MNARQRLRHLRLAVLLVGGIFAFGLYPLTVLWPEAWMWEPRQYEYEQMIVAVYFVLGIFLILASRDPLSHGSLIWFTVWSSLVHGGVMAVQALADPADRANLLGDVPALLAVGVVLGVLMARARPGRRETGAGPGL